MDTETLSAEWQIVIGMAPFLAAITAWYLNEAFKRRHEMRKNKEERYFAFLESAGALYSPYEHKELKDKFFRELRLAWLYCPDEIIKKCNTFLAFGKKGSNASPEENEKFEESMFDFILALRKDIYSSKTKLTIDDYEFWHTYDAGQPKSRS